MKDEEMKNLVMGLLNLDEAPKEVHSVLEVNVSDLEVIRIPNTDQLIATKVVKNHTQSSMRIERADAEIFDRQVSNRKEALINLRAFLSNVICDITNEIKKES